MSVHVLVTGDDEFPTWIPSALPIWTTFERVEVFIDVNQVVGQSVELFYSECELARVVQRTPACRLYVCDR